MEQCFSGHILNTMIKAHCGPIFSRIVQRGAAAEQVATEDYVYRGRDGLLDDQGPMLENSIFESFKESVCHDTLSSDSRMTK